MYKFTAIGTDTTGDVCYELSANLNKDGSYSELILTEKFNDGSVGFIWDNEDWLISHLYKELKKFHANNNYVIEDIGDDIPERYYEDLYIIFREGMILFGYDL